MDICESVEPKDQIRLPQSFYRPSSTFGYLHTLPDMVLFAACIYGLGAASIPLKLISCVGATLITYRMTFIMHDCAHRTLFRKRWENEFWGWLCSSCTLATFPTFRRLHFVHHRHFREPADPQGSDYNGLIPTRDRVLLHLLKPLLFLNLVEKVGNTLALAHCGMTPEEQRKAKAESSRISGPQYRLAAVCILVTQGLIATVATRGFTTFAGYALFLILLPSAGLFLSRLRSYLEHGDIHDTDGSQKIARTHKSNVLERNILCSILFNYHNEHHRWPQVPSRLLPALHAKYTAGRLSAEMYSPSYARSLIELVRTSVRGRRNA